VPERLQARSLARPVQTGPVSETGPVWHVLAVFERACHLVTPGGDVVALVVPQIGDGPLNVVVEGLDRSLGRVQPGMPATLRDARLRIGDLEIALDGAVIWEPRPGWARLRAHRDQIARRLPLLHTVAHAQAPTGSLLALLPTAAAPATSNAAPTTAAPTTAPPAACTTAAPTTTAPIAPAGPQSGGDARDPALHDGHKVVLSVIQEASLALGTAWRSGRGTEGQLAPAAARLAGLGHGLTPAGDDFLMGAMLRAWLAHPEPGPLCRRLAAVAAPRTTTLSAALLQAAARGECSAAWHALLAALAAGDAADAGAALTTATRRVLAHGGTSGGDTLAGFLLTGHDRKRQGDLVHEWPVNP
jgi:hypothetical protein